MLAPAGCCERCDCQQVRARQFACASGKGEKSHPVVDGLICWRLLSGLELGHRSVEFAGELAQTAGGICRVTDGGGTFFRHLGDGFDFVRNVVAGVALLGN